MEEKYIDLSRIEKYILLENYLLMLVFPDGYVPLRVVRRDPLFYYIYDPVKEGAYAGPVPAATTTDGITNLGWQSPQLFTSKNITGVPPNVLRVTIEDHIYQVFFGVAPSAARVYRNIPAQTSQAQLDIYSWSQSYNMFGWIDGFDSPFYNPSPLSEMILTPELDVAFGIANPLPIPISPLFNFVINRIQVDVVRDADLVNLMLQRKVYVTYRTIGGLGGFTYNPLKYYKMRSLIKYGMSVNEIKQALGV